MKILHVLGQLPAQTGSGVYYQNLVTGMEEKGVKNALLYALQKPFVIDLNASVHFPVEFLTSCLDFPIVGMSDVMPYPSTVYSQMTHSMLDKWKEAFKKQLINAKEEFQPDIIICHHLWYLTSMTLDIFPNTPIIGVSHGTDIRQATRHPHLKNNYAIGMNRLSLVFALSASDKEEIIETFAVDPEKITVIGNGFNADIFNLQNKQQTSGEKVKIVYAGKITRSKGVFELAQTFPLLKERYSKIEMHLIGNGEEGQKETLYNLAKQQKDGDFHLHPSMPQKDLAHFLKSAHVFVLPSYYEGLATIALEALACGLRAVVTELIPLKKLLEGRINDSGIIEYVPLPRLVDQDQPVVDDIPFFIKNLTHKLAIQIERVLNNKEIPSHVFGELNQFSWPHIIDRQFQLIQDVIKKHQKHF